MAVTFVRQLGFQSGVQLNPLRDETDGLGDTNSDQQFAIAARLTRGRIDRPFRVNQNNILRKVGTIETTRANELNEAYIHLSEALNKGAVGAVVHRMTTDAATLNYIVVKYDGDGKIVFSVSETVPSDDFILTIRHFECFNDGIKVSIHADSLDADAPNDYIYLEVLDKDNQVLYDFSGSLNPLAKNDFNETDFIESLASSATENIELVVGGIREITKDSGAYGRDDNDFHRVATSEVLSYFVEGDSDYGVDEYKKAKDALRYSEYDYDYISSGGSKSPAFLDQMAQLAFATNRQLRWDIDGSYTVEQALLFMRQLNLGNDDNSHLLHCYWSPLESDDPTGINGRGVFGTATRNIAYACARNAQVNAKGFAPKHYPIGGKKYPIDRTGIRQLATPTANQLSDLARAKINPVLLERYTGGSRYVYIDTLTMALTHVSYKKSIAVADMSTTIDKWITQFAKEVLQLPMVESIRLMNDFLTKLFEGAEASGWLDASTAKSGQAWVYELKPSEKSPSDCLDLRFGLHYVGITRKLFVTQTLTK